MIEAAQYGTTGGLTLQGKSPKAPQEKHLSCACKKLEKSTKVSHHKDIDLPTKRLRGKK